jgi:ubiquinone/menaquinone biosynthesis C-methylase UbiE
MEVTEQPSPLSVIFDTMAGFQRSAAMRSAIDLDLFTAVGEGNTTVEALARRCEASERGVRMLADVMATLGWLKKSDGRYALTPDAEVFLDRRSPGYVGSIVYFLNHPTQLEGFARLTDAVRKGGTAMPTEGAVAADHPMWVDFARHMSPLARIQSELLANLLEAPKLPPTRVLDVAAGHGWFGITLAKQNPNVEVVALDWANVLQVAQENARAAGVAERVRLLPGDAFTADLDGNYDLILITNLLHHFDVPTCETLLRRLHGALKPGGRAVTLEFIPNEERTDPPAAVAFSLIMLAHTPGGDAYTFGELERMLRSAGFSASENHALPPSFQRAIVSRK